MPVQESARIRATTKQLEAARLLALGNTEEQVADKLGITLPAVRDRLRNLMACARVGTPRALVHRLLEQGLLEDLALPHPPSVRWDELTQRVCGGLRFDVPDRALQATIARALGIPGADAGAALARVRQDTGLTDCALVALAFRHRWSADGKENTVAPGTPPRAEPPALPSTPAPRAQDRTRAPAPGKEAVMRLLADELVPEKVAGRLGLSLGTVYRYMRSFRTDLGLETVSVRALLCAWYERELLPRPCADRPLVAPGSDAVAVWQWLGLDVTDADLPAAIAGETGLQVSCVKNVLSTLAAIEGTPHLAGLVRAGYERAVLPRSGPGRHAISLVGPDGVTKVGRDVQAVRIPLISLPGLLKAAGPPLRGPALVETATLSGVLFLPPGSVTGWKAPGSSLVRRDHVYRLPPPETRTGVQHWAVPPGGPLWKPQLLRNLLCGRPA
ncbi:helix-turn-helix transcriptional regulator [Streptomyces sp. NPDC015350]|uniref:helix-turn-helix transcriptional regulator n=1 Tax=Streptomyces sp. NPDC015350 TaxID=3364955 RepID=UPI003702B2B2